MAEAAEEVSMEEIKTSLDLMEYYTEQNQRTGSREFKVKDGRPKRADDLSNKSLHRKQIGFPLLQKLLNEDPLQVILTFKAIDFKFSDLGKPEKDKRRKLTLFLKVLARACDCQQRQNLSTFINTLPQMEFIQEIQGYLIWFKKTISREEMESVEDLVKFVFHFQAIQPVTGSEMFAKLEPFITSIVERDKHNKNFLSINLTNYLSQLQLGKESFFENMTEPQARRLTQNERLQSQAPPNSFREIDILPTKEDIEYNEKPFLRPNIKEGRYADADHYLDVQFRLLREDFVRPLREGIHEYKLSLMNAKTKKYFKDIKIYTDVKVLETINTEGGLLNVIKFNIQPLKHIRWECSKRLLYGSLVCFTRDNFETLLFATVVKREPILLKSGYLEVQFESASKDFIFEARFHNYIMVETSAYFEAYRYVLRGLQTITEQNFPFKNYIVDVEKDVNPPGYLRENSLYDMRPLLQPMTPLVDLAPDEGVDAEIVKKSVSYPSNLDFARSIPVLDLSKWPSRDECGLDEAQYCALQSALTKEFVIIQGPPGTGKTFLGLRIVQLFLQNSAFWSPAQRDCPILIVCYTNHALDQFLEGILAFTDNLVRVGGRCQSELLESYKINNVRQKCRQNRTIPFHIHKSANETRSLLKHTEKRIIDTEGLISSSSSKLVPLDNLVDYIKPHHFSALGDSRSLLNWLCVDDSNKDSFWEEDLAGVVQEVQSTTNLLKPDEEDGAGEDGEEEVDVDLINAMREIDHDEYKHNYDILKSQVKKKDDRKTKGLPKLKEDSEEWITPNKKRKQNTLIKKMLIQKNFMTDKEENSLKADIWGLDFNDRWRLYTLWVGRFNVDNYKRLKKLQGEFVGLVEELKEIRMAEDISLAQKAKVVGMTTSGAAKFRHIVEQLGSRIVVVEEAAEVLEAHVLTSLTRHTQHLVMIGDHQQLRPSPTVFQLARTFNLDVSLFERMVNNDLQCNKLVTQHRMRPCISQLLVPHIYPVLRDHASVQDYEDIKGVTKNMFFISHQEVESHFVESQSHSNVHEASFLVALCKYLRLQDYKSSQITILTTYSSQMFTIKKMIRSQELLKDVRVTAVDNYQGEENDIILISFVRSNDEGSIGFLKTSNRVCVALSRARKGLYCIGNFSLLAEKSPLWRQIVSQLENDEYISEHLELRCQLHLETLTKVQGAKDFLTVPEGGCDKECLYRLECGHTCTRVCHPYDRDHQQFRCMKKCQKKICDNDNHRCKKLCCQECGDCHIKVLKKIPRCNHEVNVPCYLQPELASCTEQCPKILPCGHQCKFLCSDKCPECAEKIEVRTFCGHGIKMKCGEEIDLHTLALRCEQRCATKLPCGDICQGTCGTCYQSRIHIPCKKKCERIFLCGHSCNKLCAENCPPCTKPCENLCYHNICPVPCGVPCTPCIEVCNWSCPHYKCTKLCHEDCDRPPCNKPCPKPLKCQHPCMGFCGEPCPKLCGICHSSELREIFFGDEDEEDARFVLLEDCKHVFESSGLTKWMKGYSSDQIQMKSCPLCKIIIRQNYRFGNIIKQNLRNIEMVKSRNFGTSNLIGNLKNQFQTQLENLAGFESFQIFENCRHNLNLILSHLAAKKNDAFKVDRKISFVKISFYINVATFAKNILNMTKQSGFHYLMKNNSEDLGIFTKLSLEMIINRLLIMLSRDVSYGVEDVQQEMKRILLIVKTCTWKKGISSIPAAVPYFAELSQLLQKPGVFTEELNKEAVEILKKASKVSGLGISMEEKQEILKALDMNQGHWFKCPNGHLYCITECGGAMEEGKCNECGAAIGGQSHRLRSDNALGTEMDGARAPAWPQNFNYF